MRLAVCCLISVVLHGLLALAFSAPPNQPLAIDIEIKTSKKIARKLHTKTGKVAPRFGSEGYRHTKRPLGDTLASEHYLERLHAHIDPNWQYFVRMTRLYAVCETVLWIDADSIGTVTAVVVVQNTCPDRLKQAAIDAIYYANLLPPPKLLLDKQGVLKLEWVFKLSKKD